MKITEDRLREIIQESINKVILEMSPARLSQMNVIRQFQEKHGINRYDYSKVKYVNDKTNVIIGCPNINQYIGLNKHHITIKEVMAVRYVTRVK